IFHPSFCPLFISNLGICPLFLATRGGLQGRKTPKTQIKVGSAQFFHLKVGGNPTRQVGP
ncbi:MAG: hypothetical protein RSC06_14130, partial [Clostridia bacterium]